MQTVTVKNYEGKEYTGVWNEKTYTSQIEGHPELYRIYLSDVRVHITAEELSMLGKSIEDINAKREFEKAMKMTKDFEDFSLKNKLYLLRFLLADDEVFSYIARNHDESNVSGESIVEELMDMSHEKFMRQRRVHENKGN